MTDREVMKMAFDAFEDLKKSVTRDGTVSENWDAYYEKEYYALEALRQALAQPEQEHKPWQGLTEEEIATIFFHFANKGVVELTRVIEANFKRKNT